LLQRWRSFFQLLALRQGCTGALQAKLTPAKAEALQAELADIDMATMTVPMRHSHLYFMLRYHLDQTRSRLIEASRDITMAQMSETSGQ
jgi:hypothetical protein